MLLIPRYGTDPVIVLDGDPSAIAEPAIRQRRRLAALLADLDDGQWGHPSRCAGIGCPVAATGMTSAPIFGSTADAVELLEALSFRRPLDQVVPDEFAWMLRGLADTFDVTDR